MKERSFWIGYFLYIINKNRDKSAFHETVLWQLSYAQLLDTERALVFNAKSAKTSGWRYKQSLYRISWSTIWNWPHWTVVHNRVKAKKQVGLKCRKLIFFFIYLSICRIYRRVVLSIHKLRKYFTAEIFGSLECHQVGLPLFEDEGSWHHAHKCHTCQKCSLWTRLPDTKRQYPWPCILDL